MGGSEGHGLRAHIGRTHGRIWRSLTGGLQPTTNGPSRLCVSHRHGARGRPVMPTRRETLAMKPIVLAIAMFTLGVPGAFANTVFRDCEHCPEMVAVPAGSFTMGSPSSEEGRSSAEGPQHDVTFSSPFAVGMYEVTRGEFGRFVEETGRLMGNSCGREAGRSWRSPGFSQEYSHPVVCVSWEDARAYASWLSQETGEEYRLLSESEWEYVARAGTQTARYWGESASDQCRYANGADASSGIRWVVDCADDYAWTSPVGSFDANGFGLHDVLGNVREWVEDCWHKNYDGAPRDGRAWLESDGGDCSYCVLRGGSWRVNPGRLRSANRYRDRAGNRPSYAGYVGFRVARTSTP